MPDRYAPALLLDVLAFWFVLRWLLSARMILLVGRMLIVMMVVGMLGTLDRHHDVWALFFAASAGLAWLFLRRWSHRRDMMRWRRFSAPCWRHVDPTDLATWCERRVGLHVDAAMPAAIESGSPCVLALAGDALWVLEDESRVTRAKVGRVTACWARHGLVAHVDHARRGERFELSWPEHSAFVRAVAPRGRAAHAFAGHLAADEFARLA